MTDLTEFLLARIAEDEAVAMEARPEEYLSTRDRSGLRPGLTNGYAHVECTSGRVLAECDAKRQLIELTIPYVNKLLALPYADHPDYRSEWRP